MGLLVYAACIIFVMEWDSRSKTLSKRQGTHDKRQTAKKKKKKLPSTATALANERKRINDRIRTSMIGKHFLVFTFYMQFYAFNLFIEFINTDRGCFSAYCKNCAEK